MLVEICGLSFNYIIGEDSLAGGTWENGHDLILSFFLSIFLGFLFATFANNDMFHCFFRWMGITRETSFPSEWYGAFSRNPGYIVLHLVDDRRLYGWPSQWPSSPDKGQFLMEDVSWLNEEGGEVPIKNVSFIISIQEVQMVEFVNATIGD